MSKFNKQGSVKTKVSGPIKVATISTGTTFEGAPGFERDAKSELFLLSLANFVGEKTFYESAGQRDERFEQLVSSVAVTDPEWFAKFVGFLRGPDANMRSASLVAAAEGVRARLAAGVAGGNRQIVSSVLQRADEPGEMIAYWLSKHGRPIPKPIKRGINDAIARLYNEYGTLKYDTQAHSVRFADVIALTRPVPIAPWQDDLFEFVNARRWDRVDEFRNYERLGMIAARQVADRYPREAILASPDLIKAAGYTWENIAGKGKMDAQAWEAVIPSMGIFALLRNLRNFDQAGISSEAADFVRAKLTDPEVIAKSRLFPFRFLSAYQAVKSENWSRELETAVNLSLENVPSLDGATLVLVDRSGSMHSSAGGSLSDMSRADVAALFGTALALRAEKADLYGYDNVAHPVSVSKGQSVLKTIRTFPGGGGTRTQQVLMATFKPGYHKRVVIVTDEQATGTNYVRSWGELSEPVGTGLPENVPLHAWNLAGYKLAQSPGAKNHFWYGGLTDAAFRLIPLVEAGKDGSWDTVFGK